MKAGDGKITFFLPDLSGGGEERILINIAKELNDLGFDVDFLVVKKRGALARAFPNGIRLIDLKTRISLSLTHLIQYLKTEKPGVLISSLEMTNMIALLAVKLSGGKTKTMIRVAIAVSKHRNSIWKVLMEKILMRLIYPMADVIVTVSKEVEMDLIDYARVNGERLLTIYNPVIHHELFEKSEEKIFHKWMNGDTPIVLGVGRLTKQKDFATLIKAFSLVIEKMSARLIILGDGDERKNLEELVGKLGIQEYVDFPGFVNNPYPYFKMAAVCVLSSLWEGLPSVLIESLALGTPVVATDCPYGVNEILDHGKYGRIVPMQNIAAMSEAIIKTLDSDINPVLPASWQNKFTMDEIARQTMDALGIGPERPKG